MSSGSASARAAVSSQGAFTGKFDKDGGVTVARLSVCQQEGLDMVASICTSMREAHRKIMSVSMSAPHVRGLASNIVSNLRSLSDANDAMMKSTLS